MKKQNFTIVLFLLFALLSGCEKDELTNDSTLVDNQRSNSVNYYDQSMTILGEELPNPFTLQNMDSAYAILKSNDVSVSNFKAKTTHLYIRFLPKDFEELDILKDDTTLTFFEYPLHFKIKKAGGYYHDPELPIDAITWQYCVWPIEKAIPKVEYQLLSELCMPEDSEKGKLKSENLNDFYGQLTRKAVQLVNPEAQLKSVNIATWTPSGNLTNEGFPIEGIEVIARENLFHIHKGWTDGSGYFVVDGTFNDPVEYSANWERYNFSILEGAGNSQTTFSSGSSLSTAWNPIFSFGNGSYQARIFKAAYHYYYKDIYGLRRPPMNSLFATQMKIHACNGNNTPSQFYASGSSGYINICESANPDFSKVYAATIHELAHAAHYDYDHSSFNNTEDKVLESWAAGAHWYITRQVFPNYSYNTTALYTGVVPDLNQMYYGYSISQIEGALFGQTTWNGWRDNIKNLYYSPNESYVDVIFATWQ